MKKYIRTISIAVSALFISQVHAGVTVIDFDKVGIVHGTIVDDEYLGLGVGITSVNTKGNVGNTNDHVTGLQVAFNADSNVGTTSDPDLEYNNNGNDYNGGGAFSYTALNIDGVSYGNTPGNILILQENDTDCDSGVCSDPDDEGGSNPAGYFEFTFDTLVDIISLDTFDIEDNGEFVIQFFAGTTLVSTLVETGKSAGQVVSIFNSPDYIVQAGDNTLQTMGDGQFVRQLLNVVGIDSLRIQLPGSGAIDNLAFRTKEVSAPASLGILSLALLLMIRRARK
jgi:hypothetical protein